MGLRVPANCSSITFTVSGVKTPVARIITGLTPAEETALAQYSRYQQKGLVVAALVGGAVDYRFPVGAGITSITINGNVKAVDAAGLCTGIIAADAAAFMGCTQNEPFQIGAA